MCQQFDAVATTHTNNNNDKMKPNYSIKRVLKTLFKKHAKQQQQQHQQKQKQQQQQHIAIRQTLSNSLESLESLENLRNSQMEEQHFYEEIEDNSANEKLADLVEEHDIYVPVRFARTNAGTFFWTTNLQPVSSTIAPTADEDLLQPAYCYSNCQYPHVQFQDRWAQA